MWGDDVLARDVDVVAEHVAHGSLATEPSDLLLGEASAAHHGAGVVGAADPDQGDVGVGRHLEGVGDGVLLEQPVAHLGALHVRRGVEALGLPSAPVGQRPADLVGVGGCVDAGRASHGAGEHAVDGDARSEVAGHRPGVAPVAHRHHRTVVEPALQVAGGAARHGGTLRLGVGAGGADDGLGEVEGVDQAALQVEVETHRHLDVHLDDTAGACPVEEPLHLGAGQPELVGDLALGPAVDVRAVGDAGQQLVLLAAQLGDQPDSPFDGGSEQLLTAAQVLTLAARHGRCRAERPSRSVSPTADGGMVRRCGPCSRRRVPRCRPGRAPGRGLPLGRAPGVPPRTGTPGPSRRDSARTWRERPGRGR